MELSKLESILIEVERHEYNISSFDRLCRVHAELLKDAENNNRKTFIFNLKETEKKQMQKVKDNSNKKKLSNLHLSFVNHFAQDIQHEIGMLKMNL